MGEYTGIKFTCINAGKLSADVVQINSYLQIDSALKKFLSPLKNEGNMSMRTQKGFIIKGAGEKITELTRDSLSHTIKVNEKNFTLTSEGKTPSSESFLHYLIYKHNPSTNIILHFHDDSLLNSIPKGKFPTIPPFPYGSLELAREAAKPKESIILMEKHGFLLKAGGKAGLWDLLNSLFYKIPPQ